MERLRHDRRVVALLVVVAAVGALLAGAEPTGSAPVDAILVAATAAAVVMAGVRAPWWTIVVMATVATVAAPSVLAAVVGALAVALALAVGLRESIDTVGDEAVLRAAAAAVAVNLLFRLDLDGFLGAATLVGVAATAPVVIGGLRGGTASRPMVLWIAVGVAAFIGVGLAGVVLAGLGARDDLSAGNGAVRAGLEELDGGDFDGAATRFRSAAESFAEAERTLNRPWILPARALPIVAQNHAAVADLSEQGADLAERIGDALATVDTEAVRPVDGRIDLTAIEALQEPLRDVDTSVAALRRAIDDVDSAWLVEPLDRRLDDIRTDVDDRVDALDTLVAAVEAMPAVLGADEPRRYFVAFTTPAEARGLGGFMGNYAEVTADDGVVEVTRAGRTGDLNRAGGADRRVTGPDEWVALYGGLGFNTGPGGTTGRFPWSNVTISPHFPSTAEVIAELYPQSGGAELDGVIAMDPEVLAVLVGFTGPIEVEDPSTGATTRLTESNLVPFLLVDQYAAANDERLDLLEQVSTIALARLLDGALPDPQVLVEDLGPLGRAGRLSTWSRHADEQAVFDGARLSGAVPLRDGDGAAFVVNNAGANKLDAYLDRSVVYRVAADPAGGAATVTASISLTNDGPVSGFSDGVIGNYTGDPIGTNRTRLSIYTATPPGSVTLDGEPLGVTSGRERGWYVSTATVAIPSGDTVTIDVSTTGVAGDGDTSFTTFVQPLADDVHHDIEVTDPAGNLLVDVDESLDGHHRWGPEG